MTAEGIKRVESIKVGSAIYIELCSFARTLAAKPDGMTDGMVDYFKGFLVRPYFDNTAHFWLPNERELVDIISVPRIHYTSAEGPKEDPTIKANKNISYTNDSPAIEDLFVVKVVDRTTGVLADVDKRILAAIEENEKVRKSNL